MSKYHFGSTPNFDFHNSVSRCSRHLYWLKKALTSPLLASRPAQNGRDTKLVTSWRRRLDSEKL